MGGEDIIRRQKAPLGRFESELESDFIFFQNRTSGVSYDLFYSIRMFEISEYKPCSDSKMMLPLYSGLI
jgi:hypothetical protein